MDDLARMLSLPGLEETVARTEGVVTELILSGHSALAGPCLRIARAPGKRLRPILTLAAAACGGPTLADKRLLTACAAVELVHTGSLVHDDMMDDSHDRRGVESISAREGRAAALLCGDYLLALGAYAGARVSQAVGAEIPTCIAALCGGQIEELNDNFNPHRSCESILRAIEGKTASLMRTSCRVGALCAGLPHRELEALTAYGRAFGMSFQIVDDVLDFVSSQALFGKPVLNDLRSGVYTLPVAFARAGKRGERLVAALQPPRRDGGASGEELTLSDAQAAVAVSILRSSDCFTRALELACAYADEAAQHLDHVDGAAARGLARLPRLYIEDQLERKIVDPATAAHLRRCLQPDAKAISMPAAKLVAHGQPVP